MFICNFKGFAFEFEFMEEKGIFLYNEIVYQEMYNSKASEDELHQFFMREFKIAKQKIHARKVY